MKRTVYGVIAANAADIEQREILSGIIEKAQENNIDIAVIANIYNPNEPSDVLKTENKIYDLIFSDTFSGFILISESIINPKLQEQIRSALAQRKDIPVIVVSTPLPELVLPHFHFINTSDENDMEEITDHLIDVHGFQNIHILTGHNTIEASHKRVEGYRRSLKKHGLKFNQRNVFFGDFWMNSGHAQASRYISGELAYPEALICANDYMAYGVLDKCMERDIQIPQRMTLIGYEYIRERRNHTPLLTTYQRNRKMLGAEAVRILTEKLTYGKWSECLPLTGRIISGDTCPCCAKNQDIKREIQDVQTKATYDFLNLFSQLEHRLTECRNIDEFVARCWEFQFMIRNVGRLYMCLYENWYKDEENTSVMTAYNLLTYEKHLTFKKEEFSILFGSRPAPYYFSPLFFADRELGFVVLSYDAPDTYDHIYRNWLKSIANGLAFLRMKNDIQYLTECQNLTEFRDIMTDMLNEKGLENAYLTADKENLICVAIRTNLYNENLIALNAENKLRPIIVSAEAVKEFCHHRDICAKIGKDMFVCLIRSKNAPDKLKELLTAVMYQHQDYIMRCGTDSFVCCAFPCGTMSFSELIEKCSTELDEQAKPISERRCDKHYHELLQLRNYIYLNPNDTFDSDKVHAQFHGSAGHIRAIYKKCFGVSFHQDCINARIAKAKYYLAIKQFTTNQTADVCGFSENKYFMRQFLSETGMTANQYRCIITFEN